MFNRKSLLIRPASAIYVLAVLAIIGIGVSLTVLLAGLHERELNDTRIETASLDRMLTEQTAQAFDATDFAIQGIQDRLYTGYGRQFALDSPPVHLLLSARAIGMGQVSAFFIVGPDGMGVNSSRRFPSQQRSAQDRDYYRVFANGSQTGLFVGDPVRSRVTGAWTLHLARRLDGPDGKFRGVVVASINLDYFERLYSHTKLGFVRPIALYRDNGRLVASLPRRQSEIGYPARELGTALLPLPENTVRIVTHVGGDGSRQVFALGRVKGYPLLVSVTNDEVVALASWREIAAPIALGATLVSLFIAIAARMLARRLRRNERLTQALREADDRYLRTIDTVMDAIIAIDEVQNITLFNKAAERMFGIPASVAVGTPLVTLIPERLRAAHLEHIAEFMRSEVGSRAKTPIAEITGLRADGCEFPIESTISQTLIGGRPQLTAVLRDVTERRAAEAGMREANQELRRLSTSLQSVREEERTRISRELHDDLGQQLTGLKLDLSWLGNRLREGRPGSPEMVDSMRHTLDGAIGAVRRISAELRPPILDGLGFGDAVAWQAAEFARRSHLELRLDLQAAELVNTEPVATALFRIVQESLTNIARHAAATRVDISFVADGDKLVLRVKDDGKGLAADHRQDGIGFVSMRERATVVGGQFKIFSSPGAGTTVEVSILAPAPTLGEAAA